MKFALSLTLLAMSTFVGLVASEECMDTWAYDDGKDVCAEDLGAKEWGWTNGRYGTSGCTVCECPDCPTQPPAPNQAPTSRTPTPAPTPDPVTLPQMCVGFAASWSGDPHFVTFDKVNYDCQGEGEFHLLKSLNSGFEIQGRFERFSATTRPTVTKSVVFNSGDGEPKIQVTTPNVPDDAGTCMPKVYVKGVETDVLTDGIGNGSVQVARHVRKDYVSYIFYYHNSGFQVSITSKKDSKRGCILSTKVCLPYDWARANEQLVGLLGSPDKNSTNDWMDRDNKAVAIPGTSRGRIGDAAYNYCVKNWCIRSETDSMFKYLSGESYTGFNKCNLGPDTTTTTCVDNPPPALANICGTNNMECLVDGCVGGEEEAKNWLDTQVEEKESDCGREVFLETFDSSFSAKWGEIHQGNLASKFLRLHSESPKFVKQFTVPSNASIVQVEFFFYEIGDWEGAVTDRDWAHFFVWDTPLDLLGFDAGYDPKNPSEYYEGYSKGLSWKRLAVSNATDLGFGSTTDQIHKIVVSIPKTYFEDGQLRLGFLVSMTASKDNESAGVDDFRLTAYGIACDLEFEPKQPTDVKIDPIELPLICQEKVAAVWGDPHIETFDGLRFDCQGEGEFILAKSMDEIMQIQGRFQKPKSGTQASVMKALAVREVGAAPVQVTLGAYSNGKCSLEILVKGQKIDPVSGFLSDQLIVDDLDGKALVLYFPYTRLQVVAVYNYSPNFGCYLSVKICVPDDYKTVIGLLGSADGNPNNEWLSSDGTTITVAPSLQLASAYNYCTTNWCVATKAKSIFSHTQATFDAANKCKDAYIGGAQESCVNTPTSTIVGVCGDDKACIVDSCAGNITDGQASLDIAYSLFDERGCGYAMLNQDFQVGGTSWGAIAEDPKTGQKYRLFQGTNKQMAFSLGGIPSVADKVTVEFLLYALSNYKGICPAYPSVCQQNFLVVAFGTPSAQTYFKLDMFATPNMTMSGFVSGVKWQRNALDEYIHRVEIQIPKKYFKGNAFAFDVKANFGHSSLALGLDDFKLTAYANKCKDMNNFRYQSSGRRLIGYGGYGARFTSNDPVLESDDVIKRPIVRHLQGQDTPSISLDVESDECTCVCPVLSTGGTSSTSAAPRTMNLYIGHTGDECAPAGSRIGTVTMSVNYNGTATVTYKVDAGYTISQISIYAGAESLPGLEDQNILPAAEFPVTDSPRAGTATVAYVVDLITCDYYLAAYAKVCGNFPPTGRPTASPILTIPPSRIPVATPVAAPVAAPVATPLPTATPTGTPTNPPTGTPTATPTGLPTHTPTMSPTTLSPTVASGHPSAAPTTASPTTGTPTSAPTVTPTGTPTRSPTGTPTGSPTGSPTGTPATAPVATPVASPAASPVATPAATPVAAPVAGPVAAPAASPLTSPVASPVATPVPTGSPRGMPTPGKPTPAAPTPGSFGDPHIMVWNGTQFDFHGACDLVLLHDPNFANGLGMELHIRTKIDTWWSYIETAVLRIGKDTFEVMGGDGLRYWINGNPGKTTLKHGRALSHKLADEYMIRFRWLNDRQHSFTVDLGNGEAVLFKTYREFVRVNIEAKNHENFAGSSGLMGSFPGGLLYNRANSTILADANAFGQEWQVLDSEPKLFRTEEGPQHPQQCAMPTVLRTASNSRRRLGESMISRGDAERACDQVDESNRNACVYDVLATNDVGMALSY